MNTDPVIYEALARDVPLRSDLVPAWGDVLARAAKRPARIARLRPRRGIPTSRWALAAALVAVAGLSIGGLALAGSFGFGALHGGTVHVDATTIGGPDGISTCDLVGKSAGQVAAKLTSSGIGIEWRFTHWATTMASTSGDSATTTPAQQAQANAQDVHAAQAVTGGSSDAVSSVPDDSIVWSLVPDGQTKAFVFVQAPNDPNAPTVSTDNCPG